MVVLVGQHADPVEFWLSGARPHPDPVRPGLQVGRGLFKLHPVWCVPTLASDRCSSTPDTGKEGCAVQSEMTSRMSTDMMQCLESCQQCSEMCDQMMLQAHELGLSATHLAVMSTCAQVCRSTADTLRRCAQMGGEDDMCRLSTSLCGVCADACEACAARCAQMSGAQMTEATELMRRCASQCRAMTAQSMQPA